MNIDFIYPKSCCFCLKLKTGCYIIAIINLLIGCLLFYEELYSAIIFFTIRKYRYRISVLFASDLTPSVYIIFSTFFIYGLYKEKRMFVNLGFTLASSTLILCMYVIIINLIRKQVGLPFYGESILGPIAISLVFQIIFMIVIRSYWKQISPVKNSYSLSVTRNTSMIIDD